MSMMACPHCGFPNTVDRTICKSCRQDLRTEAAPVSETPLPPTELARMLEAEIVRQQAAGWRLQTRTETSNTNGCLLIFLLCLAIIPGILYAVFAKRTSSMYISIDAYGRINRMIDGQGGVPSYVPATGETARLPGQSDAPAGPDPATRLKLLDSLKAQGVLTEEEYQQRRQRILDEV
jgi:hypothetical protein